MPNCNMYNSISHNLKTKKFFYENRHFIVTKYEILLFFFHFTPIINICLMFNLCGKFAIIFISLLILLPCIQLCSPLANQVRFGYFSTDLE